MLWRKLTASEARLPQECQLFALRARQHSVRVRIHVAIVLVLYIGWAGFQIIGSVYNARRVTDGAIARE